MFSSWLKMQPISFIWNSERILRAEAAAGARPDGVTSGFC
jgi:hypothetical protein